MKIKLEALCAALLLGASAYAAGPKGYGPLTLGMTREEIQALRAADTVYLNEPMTPYQYKHIQPKHGEEMFDALIITPLSQNPLKAVLTFESGKLISLWVMLEKSSTMLKTVNTQITSKYGSGNIRDNRTEEQCIYKNGANFKINSGAIYTEWIEPVSPTDRIETSLADVSFEACPSDLSFTFGSIQIKSLAIRRLPNDATEKSKNLF